MGSEAKHDFSSFSRSFTSGTAPGIVGKNPYRLLHRNAYLVQRLHQLRQASSKTRTVKSGKSRSSAGDLPDKPKAGVSKASLVHPLFAKTKGGAQKDGSRVEDLSGKQVTNAEAETMKIVLHRTKAAEATAKQAKSRSETAALLAKATAEQSSSKPGSNSPAQQTKSTLEQLSKPDSSTSSQQIKSPPAQSSGKQTPEKTLPSWLSANGNTQVSSQKSAQLDKAPTKAKQDQATVSRAETGSSKALGKMPAHASSSKESVPKTKPEVLSSSSKPRTQTAGTQPANRASGAGHERTPYPPQKQDTPSTTGSPQAALGAKQPQLPGHAGRQPSFIPRPIRLLSSPVSPDSIADPYR